MTGREFAGPFDVHLTVAGDDIERLGAWARSNGVKFTHIVLDRGAVPSQPMLTIRGRGTLSERRAAASACAARLRDEGFDVVRVKIEAAAWNEDVPQTDATAAALAGCYFEHHVKVVVQGGLSSPAEPADLTELAGLAEAHSAHVSRNARRRHEDGSHERFVTQRCRGVGSPTAGRRLEALLSELDKSGFAVLEAEREFVVHDDNPRVDHGWIEER
ncbi:hypothetical protein [Microbispora sp. NPDC049125]|uniref:hypothetical protein n=1 Tax=Microbispora sp. NPDC049125 TaxID=3154929 RepID=UPI003465E38D